MPNHIHLIITLCLKETDSVIHQSSLQQLIAPYQGLRPLLPGSVSSIINHLKGKVTKWCKANEHGSFQWQLRFHDHIIRDEKSYHTISNYIANNIYNWKNDENNEDGNNFRKDIRT
jgi:REP element-mobilizing transposase RayT